MSAFARPIFSATNYAAFRPEYPRHLTKAVFDYHHRDHFPEVRVKLLDLGCGPGHFTRHFAKYFHFTHAIDPSPSMIEKAVELGYYQTKVCFRQGTAEDLEASLRGSLVIPPFNMAIAAQAAHWFDFDRVWPNLARFVQPGGTVAFWGYVDNQLVGYEAATDIMEKFVYGMDEVDTPTRMSEMGPYWEQPGRSILRNLLRSVVPPGQDWEHVVRSEHEPGMLGTHGSNIPPSGWRLTIPMKLGEVEAYTRTFSCYVGWKEAHPDIKSRAEGGEGDVIDIMWDRMVETVPGWKAMGHLWKDVLVLSDWGTYLLMAKRKQSESYRKVESIPRKDIFIE